MSDGEIAKHDLVTLGLFIAVGVTVLLAFYLIRAERLRSGSWHPFRRWPTGSGWPLAMKFLSTAILEGYLGLLVWRSRGDLDWWELLIVGNVVLWTLVLWLDWARRPAGSLGDE